MTVLSYIYAVACTVLVAIFIYIILRIYVLRGRK